MFNKYDFYKNFFKNRISSPKNRNNNKVISEKDRNFFKIFDNYKYFFSSNKWSNRDYKIIRINKYKLIITLIFFLILYILINKGFFLWLYEYVNRTFGFLIENAFYLLVIAKIRLITKLYNLNLITFCNYFAIKDNPDKKKDNVENNNENNNDSLYNCLVDEKIKNINLELIKNSDKFLNEDLIFIKKIFGLSHSLNSIKNDFNKVPNLTKKSDHFDFYLIMNFYDNNLKKNFNFYETIDYNFLFKDLESNNFFKNNYLSDNLNVYRYYFIYSNLSKNSLFFSENYNKLFSNYNLVKGNLTLENNLNSNLWVNFRTVLLNKLKTEYFKEKKEDLREMDNFEKYEKNFGPSKGPNYRDFYSNESMGIVIKAEERLKERKEYYIKKINFFINFTWDDFYSTSSQKFVARYMVKFYRFKRKFQFYLEIIKMAIFNFIYKIIECTFGRLKNIIVDLITRYLKKK